jgi:hypothetical protein
MSLIERLDKHFEDGREPPKVFHLTDQMLNRLMVEDIARWQQAENGTLPMKIMVDYESGKVYYRGIPIKVVGMGLKL